ncbi:MAG TPA: DUF2905 domain-containing protein [Actinomycetota bacterium]|nr:DUF2905 domain-containing protein [Actinomycetota bacterium]
MSGSDLGKALLVLAGVLAVAGILLVVGSRVGLGRLPGDFRFGRGNTRVYIPLATSLVLSIILTVLLNLFVRR